MPSKQSEIIEQLIHTPEGRERILTAMVMPMRIRIEWWRAKIDRDPAMVADLARNLGREPEDSIDAVLARMKPMMSEAEFAGGSYGRVVRLFDEMRALKRSRPTFWQRLLGGGGVP